MPKIYLLVLLGLFFSIRSFGQERTVTGVITDVQRKPLSDVNVSINGNSKSVSSDDKGSFSIAIPVNGVTLIFSRIGSKTKEVAVSGQERLEIVMSDDETMLDDVVVTALGVKREKKELGYSVQKLNADELTNGHQVNLTDMLSGKVAGAQVSSASGSPGGASYIKLRGSGSLSAGIDPSNNGQPLFVIDGVPVNNSEYKNRSNIISDIMDVGFSNRGIDINPEDIESVDVLKGPAATSLYGSRAAGGVIMITTKKGTAGRMKVAYTSSFSIEQVNKFPELQNKYAQGSNGIYSTADNSSWGPSLDDLRYNSKGDIVAVIDSTATDKRVTAFDNVGSFFQKGLTASNNISISGGSDNSTYFASISNTSQRGIIPMSSFQRTTVRLNGSTGTDKFKVSSSVLYTNSGGSRLQQGNQQSSIMVGLLRTPPSYDNANGKADPVNDEGAYLDPDGSQRRYYTNFDNPYFSVNKNTFKDDVNRINGYLSFNYIPFKWLSALYRVGTDFYSDKRNQVFAIDNRRFPTGQIYDNEQTYREINSDFLLTLQHSFIRDVNTSLLLGDNFNQRKFTDLYVQGDGLTIPDYYNLNNATTITQSQYKQNIRLNGMFAQFKIDYKNAIYLDLTGRNDMASTFGPAKNSFFYPSASTSVIFSELLKMSKSSWFNFGKVRASYAQAGREPIAYLTQTNYVPPVYGGGFIGNITFPFEGANAFTYSNIGGNDHLKPEVTTSYEVGTNLQFFANRLELDFTWYNATSKNQIIPVNVSAASSFTSIYENAGVVENKGIELMLRDNIIKGRNFKWTAIINFYRNRNMVKSLGNNEKGLNISSNFQSIKTQMIAGQPYGVLYGTSWLRNDKGQVIINDDPSSPNYGYPELSPDLTVVGNPNPDWLGSIQNQFSYKSLSLSFLIDVKQGGDMWNGTLGILNDLGMSKETEDRTKTKVFEGVKASNGQANDIVAALDQDFYKTAGSGYTGASGQYVEDASWIRLREVSLSYSLPSKWTKKIKFQNISVSLYGRNLILLTKYKGIDPDANLKGSDGSVGLEYFNLPATKSYGVALNVNF